MKAHIQERLAQFNSNLETIRNENPRPQYVSDFSFSCSDGDYSMDYEEFIENLKEAFSNCGPTSESLELLRVVDLPNPFVPLAGLNDGVAMDPSINIGKKQLANVVLPAVFSPINVKLPFVDAGISKL